MFFFFTSIFPFFFCLISSHFKYILCQFYCINFSSATILAFFVFVYAIISLLLRFEFKELRTQIIEMKCLLSLFTLLNIRFSFAAFFVDCETFLAFLWYRLEIFCSFRWNRARCLLIIDEVCHITVYKISEVIMNFLPLLFGSGFFMLRLFFRRKLWRTKLYIMVGYPLPVVPTARWPIVFVRVIIVLMKCNGLLLHIITPRAFPYSWLNVSQKGADGWLRITIYIDSFDPACNGNRVEHVFFVSVDE